MDNLETNHAEITENNVPANVMIAQIISLEIITTSLRVHCNTKRRRRKEGVKTETKFKEKETLPKVQIKSPDGVHGEVWIDGQKVRGVRRIDFSLDAERVPAQEVILHLMANVDIETKVLPKFTPWDLQKE